MCVLIGQEVDALSRFRDAHLRIVALYIAGPWSVTVRDIATCPLPLGLLHPWADVSTAAAYTAAPVCTGPLSVTVVM